MPVEEKRFYTPSEGFFKKQHILAVYWTGNEVPQGKRGFPLCGDDFSDFFRKLGVMTETWESAYLGDVAERKTRVYAWKGRALHITPKEIVLRPKGVIPVVILDVTAKAGLEFAARFSGLPSPANDAQLYAFGGREVSEGLDAIWA